MVPVTALMRLEKRLVVVALVAVRAVMLVVASVDVPSTVNRPEVVAFPVALRENPVFSVHPDPFQYKVLPVAVPFVRDPEIVVQ
jgi:hypothetical protein